jgi:hypothetical protein
METTHRRPPWLSGRSRPPGARHSSCRSRRRSTPRAAATRGTATRACPPAVTRVRRCQVLGPGVGPTSAFSSCLPTGMHGPPCSFRANLTRVPPPGCAGIFLPFWGTCSSFVQKSLPELTSFGPKCQAGAGSAPVPTPTPAASGSGGQYVRVALTLKPRSIPTVRARPGRLSALGVSHSRSGSVWRFCMRARGA